MKIAVPCRWPELTNAHPLRYTTPMKLTRAYFVRQGAIGGAIGGKRARNQAEAVKSFWASKTPEERAEIMRRRWLARKANAKK